MLSRAALVACLLGGCIDVHVVERVEPEIDRDAAVPRPDASAAPDPVVDSRPPAQDDAGRADPEPEDASMPVDATPPEPVTPVLTRHCTAGLEGSELLYTVTLYSDETLIARCEVKDGLSSTFLSYRIDPASWRYERWSCDVMTRDAWTFETFEESGERTSFVTGRGRMLEMVCSESSLAP